MKRFDKVKIGELEPGDIFAHEVNSIKREAFKVVKHETPYKTICLSRTTGEEISKQSELKVYYLRSE